MNVCTTDQSRLTNGPCLQENMTRSTFLAAAFVLAARKQRVRVDSRKVCEALAAPRIDFNRVCEDMKVCSQAFAA